MAESIQIALKSAIASGDMEKAIEEHSHNLTTHDVEVLKAISPTDLVAIRRVEDLARLKKGMLPISEIKKKDIISTVWIGGIW